MDDVDVSRGSRALHRWAVFVVLWAVLLVFAGANVTTTRSGDAIPSWPEPYFPRDFSTPALIEWSHRGVAFWMGVFTLVLAVGTQVRETRAAVKRAAWFAVVLVVVQALIGWQRVRFVAAGIDETPTWLKVTHAVTAHVYFATLAALAVVLSPSWTRRREKLDLDVPAMSAMRTGILGVVLLLVQTLLGALGRHGVVPREVHAFVALPVLAVAAKLVLTGAWDMPTAAADIRRAARLLGGLAAAQLALGLVTYFIATGGPAPESRDAAQIVLLNLHVATGAAMLGATLSILMRTVHVFGLPTDDRVAAAERAAAGGAS
jgi:heme A synthase